MPRFFHLTPRQPINIKVLFSNDEERRAMFSKSSSFFGKMGTAASMLKYKATSKVVEEWELKFICSYDLEPVDMGLVLKVPRGYVPTFASCTS